MMRNKSSATLKGVSLQGVRNMNLSAVPKRNRRVYTRKGDSPILQSVSDCQFVTVEMVAEDTKRNVIAVRRRMLQLYRAGLLNRSRRDKLAPHVYYLSEK